MTQTGNGENYAENKNCMYIGTVVQFGGYDRKNEGNIRAFEYTFYYS